MAEQTNTLLETALERYKADPGLKTTWDVARQLGHGDVYVASTSPNRDATSPTAIPGSVVPESVLALPSPKGPVLAVFTSADAPTNLPGEAPPNLTVRAQSALGAVQVASGEPYAGLVINPGSPTATVIPAELLRIALPAGRTNATAKTLLNIPQPSTEQRALLVKALATGPVYTPIARDTIGDGKQPSFPVIPLDGTTVATEENQVFPPDTPGAIVFGTSPAEIALAFDPEKWVPVPVRINEVLNAVRKTTNVTRMLINPGGPALQLPLGPPPTDSDPVPTGEPETPIPGPSTEPDAGTREGED